MRLDLTTVSLMIVILLMSLGGVQQCSNKNMYKKSFEARGSEVVELKKQLSKMRAKHLLLSDTLKAHKQEIALLKETEKEIKSLYKAERQKVISMSTRELYASLNPSEETTGDTYPIDSTILVEVELTKVEMRECTDVLKGCKTEVEILQRSIDIYADSNGELMADLSECEKESEDLSKELKEKKRKLWGTRAGVFVMAVAVLFVL